VQAPAEQAEEAHPAAAEHVDELDDDALEVMTEPDDDDDGVLRVDVHAILHQHHVAFIANARST